LLWVATRMASSQNSSCGFIKDLSYNGLSEITQFNWSTFKWGCSDGISSCQRRTGAIFGAARRQLGRWRNQWLFTPGEAVKVIKDSTRFVCCEHVNNLNFLGRQLGCFFSASV
jgi:hypothetical protein